jgi:hypothetical protein
MEFVLLIHTRVAVVNVNTLNLEVNLNTILKINFLPTVGYPFW